MTLTRKLLHVGATALMLSTVATVTTFVTADSAYAKPGGNGNGNGNGRANREDRGSNRGQERQAERRAIMEANDVSSWGAIASELGAFNKANANENARINSSDPIHLALGAYSETGGITVDGILAYQNYQALLGSTVYVDEVSGELVDDQTGESGVAVLLETEEEVVEYFGSFEAFTGYEEDYLSEAYAAISTLYGYRDGERLTEPALDALNYMLGLNPPDPADPLPPADE